MKLLDYLRTCEPIGISKVRLGSANDGGYVVVDSPFGATVLLGYGIGTSAEFENEICTRWRIVGVAFDIADCRQACGQSPYLKFVQVGLAGAPRMVPPILETLDHHVFTYGRDRQLIVKLDIEGGEWEALAAASAAAFQQMTQLVVEWHDPWSDPSRTAQLWARLREHFHLVHVHGNNYGPLVDVEGWRVPATLECTYLRRGLLAVTPTIVPLPAAVDRPNDPQRPDYSLPFTAWPYTASAMFVEGASVDA